MKLFILALLAVWMTSITPGSLRPVRPLNSQREKPTSGERIRNRDDQLVRATQKEHALQLLRDTLNSSSSIKEVGERALLVSRAAELVWKHDRKFAHSIISRTFHELLSQYKDPEVVGSVDRLSRLHAALNRLITTMMRNDPQLAAAAQQSLTETRREHLEGTAHDPANKERFSVAQETLSVNLQKSVEIAGRILQNGVPFGFPQFLYDVRKTDVSSADALYRQGLSILADGRVYRASDAIYLSAYGFRERMMLLPTPDPTTQGTKLQFGMLTKSLSAPDHSFDPSTANAYSIAAQRYLMTQLGLGGTGPTDRVQLVQLLFLTAKINLYSLRLGLTGFEGWQQLRFDLEVRCKNAGIDQSTIQTVTGFAERLAGSDDVFQSGDASSLDRAKDIEDPKRRNEILVRGIWALIQWQRFQQAETWIKEVDDVKIRETLTDLLEYYAARASSKDRNWTEVTRRVSRIKDGRIAFMLLVDTARAADLGKSPQRKIAKQFLLDARAIMPRIAEKADRAKSVISLASLATEIYPELGAEILPEVLTAINASEDYDGSDFQILVEVLPHFRVAVSTPDSSLNVCLKRAAKIDWMGALSIAQNLNSKSLKSLALISACEAIL